MMRILGSTLESAGEEASRRPLGAVGILLSLVIASLPFLVSLWLITVHLGADARAYAPQWSDEIYNWHQIATFRVAGFDGGYYTVNEEPSPLSFSRFYAHGPAYPVLLGTLGRIVGWEINSAPVVSAPLTGLALLFFIWVSRPDRTQLLLLGLAVLTFWPMHIYMATDMRLSLFDAVAIVFAALFYRTIKDPDTTSTRFLVGFALLIGLATLSKLTWSFLFIPLLLQIRGRTSLSVVQSLGLAAVLILCAFGIHNQLAAPYPNFASRLLETSRISLTQGFSLLLDHVWLSLSRFVDPSHHTLWLVLRLQIMITLAWACFLLAKNSLDDARGREGTVILASTGLLLIMTVLLYEVFGWRDFRLLAPVLLLSMLIFIAQRRYLVLGLLLAINVIATPSFLGAYTFLFSSTRYESVSSEIQAFADEIAPVIKFDANPDGWQNTILAELEIATDRIRRGVPAGIGIAWFKCPPRLGEIKSRYLLLDGRSRFALGQRPGLRYIKATTLGDLYVNQTGDEKEDTSP